MTKGITVKSKVRFTTGRAGSKKLRHAAESTAAPKGRILRVSRLMALAIRFDQLIRDGEVEDYADLARLGQVTRARMTQIMNLLNLAPDIQEAILFLSRIESGRDPIAERDLRPIVAVSNWQKQRKMWAALR